MVVIGKLKLSQFELLQGRKPHLPRVFDVVPSDFDFDFLDPERYLEERLKKQKESEDIVKLQNKKRFEHQKNQNDRCLASDDVPVKTFVFITNRKRNRKRINKLDI